MPIDALMGLHRLPGTLTQDTRLLQLHTPQARLVPECVRGEEGIGQGFRFSVSALAADAGIALKSLIGQPALLQLLTAHSRDTLRPFHGYITGAEMSGANGGLARYQLTIEPWTRFLEHGRDSRIFQDMTVFDILDTVFAAWQGKGRLAPQWRFDIAQRDIYPVRSLTTQYQESDMAFAERLMSEEGLFHYFEHSGAADAPSLGEHTMVIADHNGSFRPTTQAGIDFTQSSAVMKRDGLDRWRTELCQRADSVELLSWDYRRASARSASAAAGNGQASLLAAREPLGPYAFETADQGRRLADKLMQSLGAGREVHVAAGTVRTLAPGTTFALHGHAVYDAAPDDAGRSFVVTRVLHLMHNNLSAELKSEVGQRLPAASLAEAIGMEMEHSLHAVGTDKGERPLYRVRIDAIAAAVPYRTSALDEHGALRFPRPAVRGQQTAIVVGAPGNPVHTDRDHRIKVQFHWQRGAQSHSRLTHSAPDGHTGAPGDDSAGTWVRVATPLAPVAGNNWGSSALPRVGQEVLVDFLEGDIDRPVVIGCLYNGQGQDNAQSNQVAAGAGPGTGNAPVWFPGTSGAHAHPASLSGFKSQSMAASQGGSGAYSQLVFDDTAGKARVVLQRHAAAHRGTDELNLGQLRHQADNEHLAAAGFGAELKTEHSAALRAGSGLLLSSHERRGDSTAQLDSREAHAQIQASTQLLTDMAATAQQHNARLKDAEQAEEAEPGKLPAIEALAASVTIVASSASGGGKADTGGAGHAIAYSKPHLQLSSAAGIAAVTPASAIISAGHTSAIAAGQDINCATQGTSHFLTTAGISLFTYGKASSQDKPNQETGIRLHAASGKVSSESQSGATRLTADKAITVASVSKSVTVGASKHVLLTAQGAYLKLEGGNIMLHGPGKIEFKASKKELTGPQSATRKVTLPPPGKLAQCPAKLDAAGSGGASAI